MAADQVWTLEHDGRRHRVEAGGSLNHRVRWYVDDELLAEKKTMDDKVAVAARARDGQLLVRYSAMGKPRTATLYAAGEELGSLTGLGGIDLVPGDGSDAAAYERRVLDHPTRYATVATLGGVAKVVVPILLGLLAVRFAVSIPWPDVHLPSIPLPDLPSIPWPDLPWPDVPTPDLPSVSLPDWLRWLLDKVKYVWPVVLAYLLARAEIKRRRDQARKRAERGGREGA